MALDLIPLCMMTSTPLPPADLGITSSGHRLIVQIQESIWEGERLRAKLKPGTAAADWMVIGPDGTAHIDIRLTLETHDGALIYVHYTGRRDFTQVSQGIDAPVYITPLFETSDERYLWLNKIQAVGKGTVDGNTRIYHIYELR
jgi:hypothetical protein